jgi:hypothetical protein
MKKCFILPSKVALGVSIGLVFSGQLLAETVFPATLAGHVVIPAATMISAPQAAPDDLKSAGKFTTGKRVQKLESIEGQSAGRPTGEQKSMAC